MSARRPPWVARAGWCALVLAAVFAAPAVVRIAGAASAGDMASALGGALVLLAGVGLVALAVVGARGG